MNALPSQNVCFWLLDERSLPMLLGSEKLWCLNLPLLNSSKDISLYSKGFMKTESWGICLKACETTKFFFSVGLLCAIFCKIKRCGKVIFCSRKWYFHAIKYRTYNHSIGKSYSTFFVMLLVATMMHAQKRGVCIFSSLFRLSRLKKMEDWSLWCIS